MTKDEILAELRKLSETWKAVADKERGKYYGDDDAIDQITEALDELIEMVRNDISERRPRVSGQDHGLFAERSITRNRNRVDS